MKERIGLIWYNTVSWMLCIFCWIFFRLRLFGKENIPKKGAFIVASNHQSYLDPALCGAPLKRPMRYLARDSLFKNRFFGAAISSIRAMPLKQGQDDLTTVRTVIKMLKAGDGVCLFPEGTRTEDGRIEPFKPGLGLLCRRGKAPIIPTVIDGAFECWPKGKKIFSFGSVWVKFGKPITLEQVKEMGNEEFADHLTKTVRRMQTDLRKKRGKQPYKY